MNIHGFIDGILIGQISRIQDIGKDGGKDCHYLSFTLVCVGIEFLGACFDGHPFNEQGHSKVRFKRAITELFPANYHKHAQRLYTSLRNGLAHVALSKSDIGLTQIKESKLFGTKHLTMHSGRLILISEAFFDDFVSACEKLEEMIKRGELTNPKLHGDIFFVPGESLHYISSSVSSPPASGSCASGTALNVNENLERIWEQGGNPKNVLVKPSKSG